MAVVDNVELQATCAALGYLEGTKYQKEPDCLETVKDLIRFLKREDEYCGIRRQLGEAQILQRDLLPIIKEYKDDPILLETVFRLMVNLTQPAKLCFQNVIPEDKTTRNYYLEVESQLQGYKEAFVDESLFAVLAKKLGDLLQLDWETRQEEDRLLIERILILVRNILHVPPNQGKEQRTDDDASVHDQVLWALHISGMEDLLLYLASSEDERQFSFHVLEIVSLMFREQTPDQLSSAGGSRSLTEKEQDERELAMIREQERANKKASLMKHSSRHSRFGGTFTVANMKSISEREVIYHRSLGKVNEISFDHNKKAKKRAKNRRPITEVDLTRRSTLSIRLFLKEFCVQFLENCYNPLMRAIKDTLMRSKAQENDETYYLWAMRFFMEFSRKHNFRVELVSETLSVPTFHYIQTHLQNFHEMIMSNKKEGIVWSRRMHLALKSYGELLQSLNMMDKSQDKALRESAKVLEGNVFYMMEFRDIFLILLKKFDETRQSRSFLKDLVETTHLFLKMLETYSGKNRHLLVQKKKKKRGGKKKKQAVQPGGVDPAAPSEQELEDLWDDVSGELSAIFQGRTEISTDVTPFDAASEIEIEEQRASAMYRIQECMRQKRAGEAVALFRAARDVWPEEEVFGSQDISPQDEFMALREVFYAPLPRPAGVDDGASQEDDEPPMDDMYGDEMEEEETIANFEEQEFNFKEFVMRFTQPQVVSSYVTLLADFQKNTQHTNHCIVKMLHRIGFDCNLPGMLFQARAFRIFQKLLSDPAYRVKHFDELRTFGKYVVRKFFDVVVTNSKVFVELFFLKNNKDALEIVEGYGTIKANAKKVKQTWTEEQDMELRQLYDEYKDNNDDGMDVIDHILVHMIDQSKSRRQILRQLVHLDMIGGAKDIKKKGSGASKPRGWREEEELELRQLYDEHQESDDIVGTIIANMLHPRTKVKVIEKIMEMGLVSDRKQLYKKRKHGDKKSGEGRKKRGKADESDDELVREGSDREDGQMEERMNGDDALPSDESEAEASLSESSSSESEAEKAPSGGEENEAQDEEPLYVKRIKQAVKRVMKKGLTAPLEWMKNCLRRTADDREEDGDEEPIPIVPILDEQEDAMENKAFRDMLRKLGLKPPANEQERFWRIPGSLSPTDLRGRVEAMVPPKKGSGKMQKTKKADDRFANLRALVKQKKHGREERRDERHLKRTSLTPAKSHPTAQDSSDEDDTRIDQAASSSSQSQSQPTRSQSPSQTQGSTQSNTQGSTQSNTQGSTQAPGPNTQEESGSEPGSPQPPSSGKRKRSRIETALDSLSDDSDKENDGASRRVADSDSDDEPLVVSKPSKRARVMADSGDESNSLPASGESMEKQPQADTEQLKTFPATMLSQPLSDSDSDLDDHVPIKRTAKRAAIESDSDED